MVMGVQTGRVDDHAAGSPGTALPPESAEASTSDSTAGDCPSPLLWREVVDSYRQQSTPWTIVRDGRVIRGRTFGKGPPLYFLNGIVGDQELLALLFWLLR